MNAQDMFKELGYEYEYINLTFGVIGNFYTKKRNEYYGQTIFFRESDNTLHFENDRDNQLGACLEIKEYQAIHQQMKELGWLDEAN